MEEISRYHNNSIDKNIDITQILIDLEDLGKLVSVVEFIATKLSPGSCMSIRGRCLQNIIITYRFNDSWFYREYNSKTQVSKFTYDRLLMDSLKLESVNLVETHISSGHYVIVLRKK